MDKDIAEIFDEWTLTLPEEEMKAVIYWLLIIQTSFRNIGEMSARELLTKVLLNRDKPETRLSK